MVSREAVYDVLEECYDPCCAERGISVVDMGLIEDVTVAGSHVEIGMVLTSGWCPSVVSLNQMMTEAVGRLDGVDAVDVRVVYTPVWTMDRLSPSARAKLEMDLAPLLPYREQRIALEVLG
jgi:metal-sulfur cluster biosynthetic enzyme